MSWWKEETQLIKGRKVTTYSSLRFRRMKLKCLSWNCLSQFFELKMKFFLIISTTVFGDWCHLTVISFTINILFYYIFYFLWSTYCFGEIIRWNCSCSYVKIWYQPKRVWNLKANIAFGEAVTSFLESFWVYFWYILVVSSKFLV